MHIVGVNMKFGGTGESFLFFGLFGCLLRIFDGFLLWLKILPFVAWNVSSPSGPGYCRCWHPSESGWPCIDHAFVFSIWLSIRIVREPAASTALCPKEDCHYGHVHVYLILSPKIRVRVSISLWVPANFPSVGKKARMDGLMPDLNVNLGIYTINIINLITTYSLIHLIHLHFAYLFLFHDRLDIFIIYCNRA